MASADYAAALHYLSQLALYGIKPGTERLAEVLRRLGEPQAAIPAIHIAGTNGKGSTAAYCASLLLEAARAIAQRGGTPPRIGLYTSPHLQRVRERIQFSIAPDSGLRECREDEFVRALEAVRAAAAVAPTVTLTFFEVLTALAFVLWREVGVDLAVVETGLGGRLDATRLCAARVTVITSIGFDHMELLGPTLAAIAREKAGIFRPGVPALAATGTTEAREVLQAEARRVGAPLRLYREPDHQAPSSPVPPQDLSTAAVPPLAADLATVIPLAGEHQQRNAALAVAAVQQFLAPEDGLMHSLLNDQQLLREGLARTRWPGRLEQLRPVAFVPQSPSIELPAGAELWLDAAHNPEGAAALDLWLAQELRGRPLTVLFGAVAGKQICDMTAPLRRAHRIVLTRPPSPRGLAAAELRTALAADTTLAAMRMEQLEEVGPALHAALRQTQPGGLLLVYGSIFLIAAVRALVYGEEVDVLSVQDPGRPAR